MYTGDGKGKTTAAIGQAIRALGRGYKPVMVFFLKEEASSGEMEVLKNIGVKMLFWGGEYGKSLIKKIFLEDKANIKKQSANFLREIRELIEKGEYDILVLDEINLMIHNSLIEEKEVMEFLKNKPSHLEVILTGRTASPAIISIADLVTEMRKVKHPYDRKILMRKGIEY